VAARRPRRPAPPAIATGRRPNSVGLGQRDLEVVLDQIDRPGPGAAAKRRAYVRFEFRCLSVRLDILQKDGSAPSVLVATRNLSAGGLSILHSAYAHQDAEVIIHLPDLTGQVVPLRGVVRMCRHVQGVIHEVGVQLAEQIDPRRFIRLDDQDTRAALERVDTSRLAGTVVCVSPSDMDRRIVAHYLSGTRIALVAAATGADGLARAADGADIVLVDLELPDMTGEEFLAALAKAGLGIPVIVVTSDAAAAPGALQPGLASAVLPRPLEREALLAALGEHCLDKPAAGPVTTSLAEGSPNTALVPEFLDFLKTAVAKLEASIEHDDVDTCRSVAVQIAGVAPTLGFRQIADASQAVAVGIAASMSVRESESLVRGLIDLCQRTRPSQAA
jgi:CheY-like chemotaxis protein